MNALAIHEPIYPLKQNLLAHGVNVKYPGNGLAPCKGDGVTDDTAALQAIINYAYNNKLAVYFPPGIYLTTSSIALPSRISLIGSNHYWSDSGSDTLWECTIKSTATNVFVGSTPGTSSSYFVCVLNMRNLAIEGQGTGTTLFQLMELQKSLIQECMIYNFGYVLNGRLTDVSEVFNNRFIHIENSVISTRQNTLKATIVDSKMHHNYFDGVNDGNAVLLDIEAGNYFDIHHNFFDYAYNGVKLDQSSSLGSVTDNLFDVCYNSIGVISASVVDITGNKFGKCAQNDISYFSTITAANQTTFSSNPWIGILVSSGCHDLTMADNVAQSCDRLIDFSHYGYHHIRTGNNVNAYYASGGVIVNMNRSSDQNNPNDGIGIVIQEMNNQVVTSLPSASASFWGQTVWYQGKFCVKKSGNKDTEILNITAGATTAGTITVSLGGYSVNVSVGATDSATTIATNIQKAGMTGYVVTVNGSTVTYTANTTGAKTAGTLTTNSTGVTGTWTVTQAGTADYWTDAMNNAVT